MEQETIIQNFITIDGLTKLIELKESKSKIEAELVSFFRDEDNIPLNNLAKYYLNENLNFLCGSGTSVAIGGKTINKGENPFEDIIKELKEIKPLKDHINQLIKFFESEIRLEEKFDKINQEYLYHLNIKEDPASAEENQKISRPSFKNIC